MSKQHCCDAMSYWANYRCPQHPDSEITCPDCIIAYEPSWDEYGIIIHDFTTTSGPAQEIVRIEYCPWCGTKLGTRRQQWVEQLRSLGIDDPYLQEVPEPYRTDAWYSQANAMGEGSRLSADSD